MNKKPKEEKNAPLFQFFLCESVLLQLLDAKVTDRINAHHLGLDVVGLLPSVHWKELK